MVSGAKNKGVMVALKLLNDIFQYMECDVQLKKSYFQKISSRILLKAE